MTASFPSHQMILAFSNIYSATCHRNLYNLRHPHQIHYHWYQNWSKLKIWICHSCGYLTIVTFIVKEVWTSSGWWNYRNMLTIHGTETNWEVAFHFKAFGNPFPVSFACWELQNICILVYLCISTDKLWFRLLWLIIPVLLCLGTWSERRFRSCRGRRST